MRTWRTAWERQIHRDHPRAAPTTGSRFHACFCDLSWGALSRGDVVPKFRAHGT